MVKKVEVSVKVHAILLTAVLLPPAATAQSVRGAITGTVTGASRSPVAGAMVQLVHSETNRKRSAITDALGGFTIPGLPPGEYRIEAEHEGYRKHVQRLTLRLNQEIQIGIPLLPGQRTETR